MTNASPNGWTLDTLEKYLSSRIDTLKENIQLALATSDKALTKSDISVEKRFDSVNEFRSALSDQTKNYLTITTYEVNHSVLVEKINTMALRLATLESLQMGKSTGIKDVWAILTTVLSIGIAALAVLYNIFK